MSLVHRYAYSSGRLVDCISVGSMVVLISTDDDTSTSALGESNHHQQWLGGKHGSIGFSR